MGTITTQEREAINAWLKTSKPVKVPMGYSGLFDEMGDRKPAYRVRLSKIAVKIRRIRGHETWTDAALATHLGETVGDVAMARSRHRMERP